MVAGTFVNSSCDIKINIKKLGGERVKVTVVLITLI